MKFKTNKIYVSIILNMKKQLNQSIQYQINKKYHFQPSIEQKANFLSKLFFVWTQKLIFKGARKPLEMNDLFDIIQEFTPNSNYRQFDLHYNLQYPKNKIRMTEALKKYTAKIFLKFSLLVIIGYGLNFLGPVVINFILKYLSDPNQKSQVGIMWGSILIVSLVIKSLANQHSFHIANEIAIKVMNTSTSKIYHKILKLSSSSRKYLQTGAIMNYINVDIQSFQYFLELSVHMIGAPLLIILSFIFIILQIGWIGYFTPIIFLIGLYFQNKFLKQSYQLKKDQLFWSDKRSKCVNQYFSGIRIIKYYGWQQIVSSKIQAIRKQEVKLAFYSLILRGYNEVILSMAPVLSSILAFGVYSYLNGADKLTPAKVYSCLALFNLISNPMRLIMLAFIQFINTVAGLRRVDHFLNYQQTVEQQQGTQLQIGEIIIEEGRFKWQTEQSKTHFEEGKKLLSRNSKTMKIQQKQNNKQKKIKKQKKKKQKIQSQQNVINDIKSQKLKKKKKKSKKLSIITTNQSLTQSLLNNQSIQKKQKNGPDLIIQHLHIKPKQFIGIVGQVGSGKSTLMNVLLHQVHKISGSVRKNGTVAYVPQTSWLRSATLRDNILFELQYNQQKYQNIIKICQLQSDIQILGGDQIQIGQRGVNLSGGQKQRISIARALYADSDIYLIDDCLSALDVYVSKRIYENVLKTYLKQKTVIFITHSVHLVHECNKIIVMNKGRIQELGSYQQLKQKQGSLFNILEDQEQKKQKQLVQKNKQIQQFQLSQKKDNQSSKKKITNQTQGLIKVQQRMKGSVPWSIYKRFYLGAGILLTSATFLFLFLAQFSKVVSQWWLGSWSIHTFNLKTSQYIYIYAALSMIFGVLIYLKMYVFAKFITTSSQNLQRKLIQVLLKTPLSWFDITPTGRILARTTKDQDDLDNNLSYNVQFALQQFFILLFSIILIGVATPIFTIVIVITIVAYYFAFKFYMKSGVQLKRLQSNTRAPLISHVQQTINGIYVIRAFKKQAEFIQKFYKYQKYYIVAFSNQNISRRWISLITDIFATIVITGSIFLGLLQKGNEKANIFGLSLTWSIQISFLLSHLLKIIADTENNMNGVVRLLQYIDNNPFQKDLKFPLPPENWPSKADISFKNVSYKYRQQLNNVIHGISFDVQNKAKIGIVGRTGSGKSTMTLGMLRILQLSQNQQGQVGQILLDGVRISDIGLHCLRQKVSIIPQDPILFNGTIRSNVDPFNIYKDQQIVQALKKVQIWKNIRLNHEQIGKIDKKLYSKVDGGGTNLSLGQRQLICMARALVRKPKVLLMDEATASIDEKTDVLIQKMIRKQFKDTTVITIAHRLNTIINYDKILVLDYGRVKQYGCPLDLLKNKQSFLSNLIKQTDKKYQDMLLRLARQNSKQDKQIAIQ